uniref:Uncharacterized protein n=1 Tax=Daphnia galeata TaxID=27404 RepID=A0A8J2WPL9_9CRUS|nr:unnamed protein product [Daphnia galeata]
MWGQRIRSKSSIIELYASKPLKHYNASKDTPKRPSTSFEDPPGMRVYKYVMVEDLILWNHGGFGSRLENSLLDALKPEDVVDIELTIKAILNCLFVRNQVILEQFREYEKTFEKSSVFSLILKTVAKHHGPYLDIFYCTAVMKKWFYPDSPNPPLNAADPANWQDLI